MKYPGENSESINNFCIKISLIHTWYICGSWIVVGLEPSLQKINTLIDLLCLSNQSNNCMLWDIIWYYY